MRCAPVDAVEHELYITEGEGQQEEQQHHGGPVGKGKAYEALHISSPSLAGGEKEGPLQLCSTWWISPRAGPRDYRWTVDGCSSKPIF